MGWGSKMIIKMMWKISIASLVLIMVIGTGCTNPDPTKGFTTASQYRSDVKTIAVPIFHRGRSEYRRDIEFRLTEAVIKAIEAQTPYKVVPPSRADTILLGTIRKIDQRVLSYNPRTGRAREVQVRISVDITWKDLRPNRKVILLPKKTIRVADEYILESPFSENFFLGSESLFDKTARRIVEQLANPW